MYAGRVFEEMPKETNSPPRRYSVWYCDYCGRHGHLKDFCWNLSGRSLNHSNHFRCGSDSAHRYVVSKGESHTVKVQMTLDELKKWLKFKKVSACDQPIIETTAVSAGPNNNIERPAKSIHNHTGAPWLIDSGASRHMVGSHKEFSKYAPSVKGQGVKLADGSSQAIMGTGTVVCGSNMRLSSVLHVPSFPINLLSISCITRELNCAAIFYPMWCLFKEIGTGRELGRGSMHDGLYYLDSKISPMVAAALYSSPLGEFLLLHHRLGHMPFSTMVSDTDYEIGGDKVEEDVDTTLKNMIVGAIPTSGSHDCGNSDIPEIEREQEMLQGALDETIRWPRPNEEQQVQVYTRRRSTSERQVQGEETNSQGHDIEVQERQPSDVEQEAEVPESSSHQEVPSPPPSSNDVHSLTYDDLDLPIANRKSTRSTAGSEATSKMESCDA